MVSIPSDKVSQLQLLEPVRIVSSHDGAAEQPFDQHLSLPAVSTTAERPYDDEQPSPRSNDASGVQDEPSYRESTAEESAENANYVENQHDDTSTESNNAAEEAAEESAIDKEQEATDSDASPDATSEASDETADENGAAEIAIVPAVQELARDSDSDADGKRNHASATSSGDDTNVVAVEQNSEAEANRGTSLTERSQVSSDTLTTQSVTDTATTNSGEAIVKPTETPASENETATDVARAAKVSQEVTSANSAKPIHPVENTEANPAAVAELVTEAESNGEQITTKRRADRAVERNSHRSASLQAVTESAETRVPTIDTASDLATSTSTTSANTSGGVPHDASIVTPVSDVSGDSAGGRLGTQLTGRIESMSRATSPNEIDSARFLQRVTRAIGRSHSQNEPLRIRLHPPELGMLRLEVRVEQGAMTARMEAETPAARTALLDSLPVLRERLAEQGIRIDQFDVDLMDRQREGLFEQSNEQQHSQRDHERAPQQSTNEADATAENGSARTDVTTTDGKLNVII